MTFERPSALQSPSRRQLLAAAASFALLPCPTLADQPPSFEQAIRRGERLPQLHGLLVAHRGEVVVEQVLRGAPLEDPVNIKSLAKSVVALMVGIAIDKALLETPDQKISAFLSDHFPADPDPRLAEITLGHLLSMQAGLESTSGENYGRWVMSDNWVAEALARPFVDDPGGRMIYSSGNTHLLSALLTRVSGRSTLELAREWLGEPLGITIPPWQQDPQGIYLGGNNMLLSPRALLRIGECCRQGGRLQERHIVSKDWLERSWQPRTFSSFTGHRYGYGWFLAQAGGYRACYGWGFGGQMLYIVPSLELTAVIISDPNSHSRGSYLRDLHALLAEILVPAAAA